MKKLLFISAASLLSLSLLSCSTEEITDTEEPSSAEIFKEGFSISLDIDFTKLFEYEDITDLRKQSDSRFASVISDLRHELASRTNVTDAVILIDVADGVVTIDEINFLNDGTLTEKLEARPEGDLMLVEEAKAKFYEQSGGLEVVSKDAINNVGLIGEYLQGNLDNSSKYGIELEIRVTADNAEVSGLKYQRKVSRCGRFF